MRKQIVAAGIATAVGVTGLTGFTVANAATDTSSQSPMSGLVEAISTKFNLNKDEVQAVFDAERAEMQAKRESDVKAEIAQLVTDKKITQEQADKLNTKRAELQKDREAAKGENSETSREERKTAMDAKRAELETWAKENEIDTQYLKYVMGGGHGCGGPEGGR